MIGFSKNLFKYLMIFLLVICSIALVIGGVYCGVKVYKHKHQQSQNFGTITTKDLYADFNVFDCDLSNAVFYQENSGYKYEISINKSVPFDGTKNKYNVLVNNKPSNYENSNAGTLIAQNLINYYDIAGAQTHQTVLDLSFKFYQSSVDICLENQNDKQSQSKFLEYIKFNGLHIRIIDAQYNVSQNTSKRTQPEPQNAKAYASTSDTISVTYFENAEYSIDNGATWLVSNHITNLQPNTTYTILVRYKETSLYYASECVTVVGTTRKLTQKTPKTIGTSEVTSTSITVYELTGGEYAINNTSQWQDSNTFRGLQPNTTYTVYARYKETNSYYASGYISIEVITLAENAVVSSAGLYNSNDELVYSWQELLDNNYITIQDSTISATNKEQLAGKLIIDDSVTTIGDMSFYECSQLLSVWLPDSVTSFSGEYAFGFCRNLSSVRLSKNLTNIGNYTFNYCDNLSDILLPQSLTILGKSAFVGCKKLKTINIPPLIDTLSDRVFADSGLESIYVPENVTSIGSGTFSNTKLTTLILPKSITQLGSCAFANNTLLKTITLQSELPPTQPVWEYSIIYNCPVFEAIYMQQSCLDACLKQIMWQEIRDYLKTEN